MSDVFVTVNNTNPTPVNLTLTDDPDVVINQTISNVAAATIPITLTEDAAINVAVSITETPLVPVNVTIFDPLFSSSQDFTINGNLIVTGAINGQLNIGNVLNISGAAGTTRELRFNTGATRRWNVFTTSFAETGANAGSNFVISRHADDGTLIENAFIINRATGFVSVTSGVISLSNPTSNILDMNAVGAAPPSVGTRSVGTKIILWNGLNASNVDYAIGIEGSTQWFSVPSANEQFRWYAGTTNIATLTGSGVFFAERYQGRNTLVLNSPATVNPSSNVYLAGPSNDRDAWIYRDSADSGSNWGIYHRQIDATIAGQIPGNAIGFVGGGSSQVQAYIGLADGSGFFRGSLFLASDTSSGGVLFSSHGNGRIWMQDTTWIRFDKGFYNGGNVIANDGHLSIGYGGGTDATYRARINGNFQTSGFINVGSPGSRFISTGAMTASPGTGLEILNLTPGQDAFMTFHVQNDTAGYLGMGGVENDLVWGGFSYFGNRWRVLHTGNTSQFNLNFAGLAVTRPASIRLNGVSDDNHRIFSVASADAGLPWSDGPVIAGFTGWAFYCAHPSVASYRMGFRGDGSAMAARYLWCADYSMFGTTPDDGKDLDVINIINGSAWFSAMPAGSGSTVVNAFGFLRYVSSRRELKENISTIDRSLAVERICALRPVEFTMRPDRLTDSNELTPLDIKRGLIAQEAAAVDHWYGQWGWVDENEQMVPPGKEEFDLSDATPIYWSHDAVIADLIAAMQETIGQVETMKQRIAELEAAR